MDLNVTTTQPEAIHAMQTCPPNTQPGLNMDDFDRLFKANRSRLYLFVKRHVQQAATIEDIVQQTFFEAFRCRENFQGNSRVETWLYGIAMNLIRNTVTRSPEYRYTFEDADEMGDSLLDDAAESPEQTNIRMQDMCRIIEALDKLPANLAAVVKLVLVEEDSYEEAATKLQVPVGTIRSRLSRARETLKLALA